MSCSNAQPGSRWEVLLAIKKTIEARQQEYADRESDRLADVYGELQDDTYDGTAAFLRIPDIQSIRLKMDSEDIFEPSNMPAIRIGMLGTTVPEDAQSTIGSQAFGESVFQISAYCSTRAEYAGTKYRLTEEELVLVTGALGQAIINNLRDGGYASTWAGMAGIHTPRIESMAINGHKTDDQGNTTAAKVLLSLVVTHDMRY